MRFQITPFNVVTTTYACYYHPIAHQLILMQKLLNEYWGRFHQNNYERRYLRYMFNTKEGGKDLEIE